MHVRRSGKQPFNERLSREAAHLREKANALPMGTERNDLLREARRLDVASRWLSAARSANPNLDGSRR
jgi:hypothetical protein